MPMSMMTKNHILYWIFDFLAQEHPEALNDMKERITGDAGDQWVPQALAERLVAYEEIRPKGYKFLGEFPELGKPSSFKDYVEACSDRKSVEARAREHLKGAANITMIALSEADLANMNIKEGQVRT
jgi:hypothetical protein